MGRIDDVMLYVRTGRRLTWRQWLFRPIRSLQRGRPPRQRTIALDSTHVDLSPLRETLLRVGGEPIAARRNAADNALSGCFEFIGHAEQIPVIDWRRQYESPLWTYHLQYFDFALDLAWAFRISGSIEYVAGLETLIRSWIQETSASGGVAWDSYPTGLRVANWLRALALCDQSLSAGARGEILASIAGQARHLSHRIEWHLLANHVWRNYAALALAEAVLEPAEASAGTALQMLVSQVNEQVLSDGVHFERSPMYHSLLLADLLEVIAVSRAARKPVPAVLTERAASMVQAFTRLSRGGGAIHLFNDSTVDGSASGATLCRLADIVFGEESVSLLREADGPWELPASGYYGFVGANGANRVIVDCGEPGPTYQPGHAHCDLLSFELDLAGRPVITDTGVRGYEGDPLRDFVRSTRAHNTVTIDGREQSEIWGTFRMARRAEVVSARTWVDAGEWCFEGSYRPFHDSRSVHERELRFNSRRLLVTDRVRGALGSQLAGHFHFHPDFTLRRDTDRIVAEDSRGMAVTLRAFGVDEVILHSGADAAPVGWYCPEFGRAIPRSVVEVRVRKNDGRQFGVEICAELTH